MKVQKKKIWLIIWSFLLSSVDHFNYRTFSLFVNEQTFIKYPVCAKYHAGCCDYKRNKMDCYVVSLPV